MTIAIGSPEVTSIITEFRSRLLRSLAAIAAAGLAVWVGYEFLLNLVTQPYCALRSSTGHDACRFLATSPTEAFRVRLSITGYGAMILASPIVLFQAARFVTPALYPKEKRLAIKVAAAATVLAALGGGLAWWIAPRSLIVLSEFGGDYFETFYTPTAYFGFITKLIAGFALAFETPLVLVAAQVAGLVKTSTLRSNRRVAIVSCLAAGAILTPTGDPFTLMVMSTPIYVFYEIAILVGSRLSR